jgi:hypothetical protein
MSVLLNLIYILSSKRIAGFVKLYSKSYRYRTLFVIINFSILLSISGFGIKETLSSLFLSICIEIFFVDTYVDRNRGGVALVVCDLLEKDHDSSFSRAIYFIDFFVFCLFIYVGYLYYYS